MIERISAVAKLSKAPRDSIYDRKKPKPGCEGKLLPRGFVNGKKRKAEN